MASTPSTPSLLVIPAELREMIYEYSFIEEVRLGTSPMLKKQTKRRNAGLLLACWTTYSEAIKLYYTTSTFTFTGIRLFLKFATTISKENLRRIRTLHFEQFGGSNEDKNDLFQWVKGVICDHDIELAEGVLKTNWTVHGKEVWATEAPDVPF